MFSSLPSDLPTGVPWVTMSENQTGLVVRPGDDASLRAALERLLTDGALRRRLRRLGPRARGV